MTDFLAFCAALAGGICLGFAMRGRISATITRINEQREEWDG